MAAKSLQNGESPVSFDSILWDRDEDPKGNVQHIAQHNLTKEDVEDVFEKPSGTGISRSSGRPVVFGETRNGRYIMVVYGVIDASTVRPITAYEVPRPRQKRE
jgi:uncharacterized DUF497 family protein